MPGEAETVKKHRSSKKLQKMAKQGRVFSELVKQRHSSATSSGTIAEAVESLYRSQLTIRRSG